jgi:hypothetical protein
MSISLRISASVQARQINQIMAALCRRPGSGGPASPPSPG